ncbi:putative nefa-interacting nuclear protein [Golovinomyces cichoracearum]|uniref:Putative nefa-interacting nuclear protein n=1 Tax=Golovinomyces cichoracearum TaxID=62708 RepID=A0A420IW24_9PEZI|nr:putative nefa-interacting nuclear protein [Golovinomyces cichoracearum]
MSSRFVSDNSTSTTIKTSDDTPQQRDKKSEAWQKIQEEIDAAAARRADEARNGNSASNRKSLYEILEANKAIKQEAFEEATRLRNQFRALDKDEIDFLDSVLERTREEEAKVKMENLSRVKSFLRQQAEADEKARAASEISLDSSPFANQKGEGSDALDLNSSWAVPLPAKRKRRRVHEKKDGELKRIKGKLTPPSISKEKLSKPQSVTSELKTENSTDSKAAFSSAEKSPPSSISAARKSLVNYGSDDEN